jgi:hypothetical protein
LNEAATFGLAA